MKTIISMVAGAFSALALSGCVSGAGNGIELAETAAAPIVVAKTASKNPSIVDPLTDGPTVADTLTGGKTIDAGIYSATKVEYTGTGSNFRKPYFVIQKNVSGGYNFTNGSKVTTFGYADQKTSGDAWEKVLKDPSGNAVYSTTLWNAGKGATAGIGANENGQTFHKILGYYVFDNTGAGTRERGHIIVGNRTEFSRIALRTKSASYDGYFYTNIMPQQGVPPDQVLAVSGGLKLVADFDAKSISGQSTSFTVREAGAPDFNTQNYTLWLKPTTIGNNGGSFFSGAVDSDYAWMNGSYSGFFYGGNAQEIAGIIDGKPGNAISEGFFTAVVEPTP